MAKKLAIGLGTIALIAFVGCGKKVPSGDAAFASAPAEVKAGWNSAQAAMKTNGYAAAILQLQELRARPGLSAEQTKVIDQAATAINDQMYDAANKEDPAAKKALQDLRAATGR